MSKYLLVFLYLVLETCVYCNEFASFSNNVAVEEGKRQYTSLSRESEMPKFGTCWKKALSDLHVKCKHLTDEKQSRLALAFTNCFLQKSGLDTRACNPDKDISECVKVYDGKGFTAYTNFFTHTHTMCVFLQSQIWNEETSKIITKLNENSVNVSQQLEQSNKLQTTLMENQIKSIENQEKIWSKSHELSRVMESSKENVRQVMHEFKSSTEEQSKIIMNIFDRVAYLQSILLGEVTGFYSILYNVIAIVVIYVITSTPRTREARFWLFLILVVNCLFERIIAAVSGSEFDFIGPREIETVIYSRQWLCRQISAITAAGVLYFVITSYRDLHSINNQLLMDILQQNTEIRNQNMELKNYIFGDRSQLYGNALQANSSQNNSLMNDSHKIDRSLVASPELSFPNFATTPIRLINDAVIRDNSLVASSEPSIPNFASTPIKKRPYIHKQSPATSHSYNLRQRRSVQTATITELESPQQFYEYVQELTNRSREII